VPGGSNGKLKSEGYQEGNQMFGKGSAGSAKGNVFKEKDLI